LSVFTISPGAVIWSACTNKWQWSGITSQREQLPSISLARLYKYALKFHLNRSFKHLMPVFEAKNQMVAEGVYGMR
jgi:hypothetical protein